MLLMKTPDQAAYSTNGGLAGEKSSLAKSWYASPLELMKEVVMWLRLGLASAMITLVPALGNDLGGARNGKVGHAIAPEWLSAAGGYLSTI